MTTPPPPPSDRGRNVGIGCFMTLIGAVSGSMIGVLVAKVVAFFTKAPSCPDIPTCDWHVYAGAGALLGALSLPTLVIRRIHQSAPPENTKRG
jgi:MFS family permease